MISEPVAKPDHILVKCKKCRTILGRQKEGAFYIAGCFINQRVTIYCMNCGLARKLKPWKKEEDHG